MDGTLTTKFSLNQSWLTEKDAVVFGIFEGEEIPCGLGFKKETAEKEAELLFPIFSKIKKYFAHKDFSGKLGKVAVLYPENVLYKRVILCGLGKKEELDAEKLRQVASQAIAAAETTDAATISFTLFGSPLQRAEDRLRYIFEGAVLTLYKFNAYKSKEAGKENGAKITEVEFLLPEIIEADEVSG